MISKFINYLGSVIVFLLGATCFFAIAIGIKKLLLPEMLLLSFGGITLVALATKLFCLSWYGD